MVILLWWFCSFQRSFCSFSIFMLILFEAYFIYSPFAESSSPVCLRTPPSLGFSPFFSLCQALLLPLIMNEASPDLKSLAYFLVLFQLNVTGWRLNGLSVDLFQGLVLRKVLLQNYLFPNKKTNQKNDLAELGVPGKLLHTNSVQRK